MKQTLIIGSSFFGYVERIAQGIRDSGNEVDLKLIFKPTTVYRILRALKRKKIINISDSIEEYYYDSVLDKLKDSYDTILIINGNNLPLEILKALKFRFNSSRFILYIWDDMANLGHSQEYLQYFDKVFSYSLSDSKKYGFLYRSFFYSHLHTVVKKQDLTYIGSFRPIRYELLQNISEHNHDLKLYYYLYADPLSFVKGYAKHRVPLNKVQFSPVSYNKYVELASSSKALIEIPNKNQYNITTRPIESLGLGTKLVTTTEAIKNYDFYNENNFFIMNSHNLKDISQWVELPYQPYGEEILSKYSLKAWIKDIYKY